MLESFQRMENKWHGKAIYDNETDVHLYLVMRVHRLLVWGFGLTFTLMSILQIIRKEFLIGTTVARYNAIMKSNCYQLLHWNVNEELLCSKAGIGKVIKLVGSSGNKAHQRGIQLRLSVCIRKPAFLCLQHHKSR